MIWAILALLGVPLWLCAGAGVSAVSTREPSPDEVRKLRSLESPVVASLTVDGGTTLEVAAAEEDVALLLGPFAHS
jgi:hypothetical protein